MAIGELIGTFFTAPGPGGVVVVVVLGLAATIYVLLTRWILRGGEVEEAWGFREERQRRREETRRRRKDRRQRRREV